MDTVIEFNFKNATYKIPSIPLTFNFVGTTFDILAGTSNNFISVVADEGATRNSFRLYVASKGEGAAFSIIDLEEKSLLDYYTKIHSGAFGEALDAEDIQDINIGSRG